CSNGCSFCYRDSKPDGALMSVEDFELVLKQLPATFQLALGGGEPTEHPQFVDFLRVSRKYGKVPNYTTRGNHLTPEIINATKKYCGAVAVSWSEDALDISEMFTSADIKTNLHFILSTESIQEAIELLRRDNIFGEGGINAVVFLLHKAVGRGKREDTPTFDQTRPLIREAFTTQATVAFDVCSIPHIHAAENNGEIEVDWTLLDFCDGARFTVYIDEELNVAPCSFIRDSRYTESLTEKTLDEIWFGEKFEAFRVSLRDDRQRCPAIQFD
ncbi:MAG: radical SAM/SPASM domain-containing protein, partial [Candidatus Thorarchaeota archaeon]|nr:radical SAM/SPASM domain-containing protein [Candidatus Thorarchaeota archaeon]